VIFLYKIWGTWAKFHRCDFKNVGLLSLKSSKFRNFWYIFAPKENPGLHKKLNIDEQLETFLYAVEP